jgi:hypothetical protein
MTYQLVDLHAPDSADQAATKGYVDGLFSSYAFDGLSDVDIDTPLGDGDVVYYNTSSTLWKNGTLAAAGIAVAGHNHDAAYLKLTGGTMTGDIQMADGGLIRGGAAGPQIAFDVTNSYFEFTGGKAFVSYDTPANKHKPQLTLYDTTALAANVGGFINFGGLYTVSGYSEFAAIGAYKENAVSGQYGGGMLFYTRAHGAPMVERMRIEPAGDIIISRSLKTTRGRVSSTTRIVGNTTLGTAHHNVYCDTDGGAFTVTLPAGVDGAVYRIINAGSSGKDVTVTPNGAELLLGVNANLTLSDGDVLLIVYETTEGWW